MEQYFDYSAFQDPAEDSGEASAQHLDNLAHNMNAPLQDQQRSSMYHPAVQPPMSCDVKPRLTKEQHDVLESHFQQQHKPSTNVKRGFADHLNVSLEKVNNWFQNRRAKSKQDAKKAAGGQVTLYQTHSQQFSSDSEPSPFQPSQQFSTMMQHMSSEEHLPHALGINQAPQSQSQVNGLPYGGDASSNGQFHNVNWAHGLLPQDVFDSPLDFNRRTLTQEHFDAMNRDGGMVNNTGEFESFHDAGFSSDQNAMNQVFPTYDTKQEYLTFPYPIVAPPLSSNDSTVPSIASEQSMPAFPSSHMMQNHATMSAAGSDWADSRSSSLASTQAGMVPMLPGQQQPQVTSSQWEPGQSVPVDVNDMQRQFQEAATQGNQGRTSMEQPPAFEQPLAWPADEAYARRGSTASLLAQSMGSVGLHTPQPNQSDGVFKSPAPPASIAARRQRPKPANLGITSLRSQSFGGPAQPGSPGHQHTSQLGQSIRRAMSSTVLNGGVAQGRVMKSVPGSAQRSPLNWTFADAVNSPHFARAVSQTNLAPPTPMSPGHPNQPQQASNWQDDAVQAGRHPSINETAEHVLANTQYQTSGSVPPHVSPPHTPMWFQQQYMPQRVASNVIMENTPPQSAPASQSCFPSNIFGPPPPSYQHAQHSQMAAIANSQQQQYLNLAVPDQQYQVSNVTFAPNQHANIVTSGPAPGAPLTFAAGVPVMTADGNYQMSFPPQMQMMQPHQSNSPPQMPYAFVNSNGASPMSISHPPKLATQPANDFVVHEYSPPDSVKRSSEPRKLVDSGPKNYTFANAGPVDYEEKKAKKDSSSSPASSSGTASTS